MFVRGKVIEALEQKADMFRGYELAHQSQMDDYRAALREIAGWNRTRLEDALPDAPAPGARPTIEQDAHTRPFWSFTSRWRNHQEARAWAMEILRGQTTFAVDGSQILPQRTISPPVAMVQIGWFENRHQPGGDYEKDVEIEVLPPEAIRSEDSVLPGEVGEMAVGLRRYVMETERIAGYMRAHAGQSPAPVVFFDGTLIASFAARLPDDVRARYIEATVRMLAASEKAGVPLIGYVDTSHARDLVRMIGHARDLSPANRLSDAVLLASLGMGWGDRSLAYICARDEADILDCYQDGATGLDFSQRVAFTYLKTTSDGPPARIEFPLWMLEAGRLDHVLDVVRAEAVVGNGYPYPLETADAVAVLSMEDRERFYRVFQQFAEKHDLRLRQSRKALSKRQRRT